MKAAAFLLLATLIATPAWAQGEPALREFFEGKTIVVKIDMPATSQGIDVFADAARAVDYKASFGQPESSSERMEGTLKVVTAIFARADQRIEAQFVEGVLIKYAVSSR